MRTKVYYTAVLQRVSEKNVTNLILKYFNKPEPIDFSNFLHFALVGFFATNHIYIFLLNLL